MLTFLLTVVIAAQSPHVADLAKSVAVLNHAARLTGSPVTVGIGAGGGPLSSIPHSPYGARDFGLRNPRPGPLRPDTDFVVGYPDTNEVLTIAGPYSLNARIVIVNNGTLVLDHANFTLQGDIIIMNNGRLLVNGGTFHVVQHFAYQYNAMAVNNGEIDFDSVQANFNGQSWGNSLSDSARFNVRHSQLRNGFTTVSVGMKSRISYDHSDFASEYVVADSSQLSITHCDTALVWLNFPAGSAVNLTLPPGDTMIRHWEFHDSLGVASGIGYRVSLDSVTGVLWGTFPRRGCDAVISNTQLRSTGLIFEGSDSFHVTGLVNNQHYEDFQLPVADRVFRFVNTDLPTWNFYPFDTVRFVVESCIFGEMLADSRARVTLSNSICDGSGGYIGANSNSQYFIIGSTINTQVIARGRALLFAGLDNVNLWPPEATSASIMALIFTEPEFEPQVRDTAVIFISDFHVPSEAQVGGDIPILGTANILSGPFSPLVFGRYRMFWSTADSPYVWLPVGPIQRQRVNQDTLDVWDASGLQPGAYVLKMRLEDTLGDSLEPIRGVYLNPTAVSETNAGVRRSPLVVRPNPFAGQAVVSGQESDEFELLDVTGQRVAQERGAAIGRDVPAGIYWLRPLAGAQCAVRVVKVR